MQQMSEEEKEMKSILEMDMGSLDTLGADDSSFRDPEPRTPKTLEQRMLVNARLQKLQEAWTRGDTGDSPSGLALSRGLEQMGVAERTLTYKATMLKNYDNSMAQVREIYDLICLGELTTLAQARALVGGFLETMEKDRNILLAICLFQPPTLTDYIYRHAINMCVFSLATATASGFSRGQVMEIAQGALLADVGMCMVPESVLLKNGKLTEEELQEIHKHPANSFALLEKVQGVSDIVLATAYQHHERLTGAGYPMRRSNRQVSHAARIVAIADTLSAMVHKRSHRDALSPQSALEKVMKMGQMNFMDASLIKNLVRYLSIYPIGTFVHLSSGKVGRVVDAHPEDVTRPVISVLRNEQGHPLPMKQIPQLDLLREKHEKIIRVLDGEAAKFKPLDGF